MINNKNRKKNKQTVLIRTKQRHHRGDEKQIKQTNGSYSYQVIRSEPSESITSVDNKRFL